MEREQGFSYCIWLQAPALLLPDYVALVESLISGSVSATVKCDNTYPTSCLQEIKLGTRVKAFC